MFRIKVHVRENFLKLLSLLYLNWYHQGNQKQKVRALRFTTLKFRWMGSWGTVKTNKLTEQTLTAKNSTFCSEICLLCQVLVMWRPWFPHKKVFVFKGDNRDMMERRHKKYIMCVNLFLNIYLGYVQVFIACILNDNEMTSRWYQK